MTTPLAKIEYQRFTPAETEQLAGFLTGSGGPFTPAATIAAKYGSGWPVPRLPCGGTTSQPEKTGRLPTATAAGPAVPAGRPRWPKVLVIGDGMVRGRLWIVAGWAASRRTLSSRVIAAR